MNPKTKTLLFILLAFLLGGVTGGVLVRQYWPVFIEEARATLARLLGENVDEKLKAQIFDALIRDQSLVPTRKGAIQVRMDI